MATVAPWARLVLALLFLLARPCLAQLRGLEQKGLTVYYQPQDHPFAEDALHAAVESLPTLQAALGMKHDERLGITLIVVRSARDFDVYAGGKMKPWVQGVALPGRRIVLKALVKTVMQRVVAHELTHVLLDEIAERYRAEPPRWLHEGLAKYAADDFSQADREILGRAVVEGHLLTLDQLEEAFAGKREEVDLAYAQSYTFVRFLHELQPVGGLAALLRNLGLTQDMNRALLRTYGRTPTELQKDWLQQVRQQYFKHGLPLAPELLILLAMGALFLLVHLLNRRRRRHIRARLQEEDRLRRIFGQAPHDDDAAEPEEIDEEYWE